jgi:hypothetical protein
VIPDDSSKTSLASGLARHPREHGARFGQFGISGEHLAGGLANSGQRGRSSVYRSDCDSGNGELGIFQTQTPPIAKEKDGVMKKPKQKPKRFKTTLSIPPELWKRTKIEALKQDRDATDLVIDALEMYLKRKKET